MSARVVIGDCREVMAAMEPKSVAAVVTDPLGGGLDCRVGLPVTGVAERDEVDQVVGLDVVNEESKRADVVDRLARRAAMLAGSAVTLEGRTPLRLPVRPAVRRWSAEVLRVQIANAIDVTARSRTKLPLARRAGCVTRRPLVRLATTQTSQRYGLALLARDGDVLASGRTGPPTPELESRGNHLERLAAGLARRVNLHAPSIKQGMGR